MSDAPETQGQTQPQVVEAVSPVTEAAAPVEQTAELPAPEAEPVADHEEALKSVAAADEPELAAPASEPAAPSAIGDAAESVHHMLAVASDHDVEDAKADAPAADGQVAGIPGTDIVVHEGGDVAISTPGEVKLQANTLGVPAESLEPLGDSGEFSRSVATTGYLQAAGEHSLKTTAPVVDADTDSDTVTDPAPTAVTDDTPAVSATAPTTATNSSTVTNSDGSQTTTTTTTSTVTETPQEIIADMERKAAVTQATATLQASMTTFMFQYGYTKLMADPSGGMMSDYVPLPPITANVGRVLGIVTMVGDQFDDEDVALLLTIQNIPGPMEYRPGTVREHVLIGYGVATARAIAKWHNKYPQTNTTISG